ncbi:MAG: hypothetical protein KGL95_11340, partial [Patescibacteria group bacterium]|nr:hypothetical protein [Patescibacteria group bacterium]
HQKYHIPIEIATDSHYTRKEDAKFQKYMLMVRTENTIKNLEEALKKMDKLGDELEKVNKKVQWMEKARRKS